MAKINTNVDQKYNKKLQSRDLNHVGFQLANIKCTRTSLMV